MSTPQITTSASSSDGDSPLDRYIKDTEGAWHGYIPPAAGGGSSGGSGGGGNDAPSAEDAPKSS